MRRAAAGLALLALLAPAAGRAGGAPGADGRGWFDVTRFGARGDGRSDDSAAFQAALDAARLAGGGVVHVPAGTYLLAPPPGPGDRPRGGLTIGSRTWLRGDGPASVLKVKDGAGSYRSLFTSHPDPSAAVEDVTVSDLRVDQNCGRSGGKVAETPDGRSAFMVLLAWGGRNLTVERVRFDPICGVNTVVLNSPGARDLAVRDCTFRFVKGPTDAPGGEYDNSAIYLHGRGLAATGNRFEAAPAERARGAIELHGAAGVAAGNVSRGYRSCVRVVGTSEPGEAPPPSNGFAVTGNTCLDANDAINVWALTGHGVRGVTIAGNTVALAQLDHLAAAPDLEHHSGISFVWDAVSPRLRGAVQDVVIEGNVISAQPSAGRAARSAYGSAGIALTPAGDVRGVVVRGNVLRDLPVRGIALEAKGPGARASHVRIEGNLVLDAGQDPSGGRFRAGIEAAGVLEDVEIAGNTVEAARPGGTDGLRVTPASGSARVRVRDNHLGPGLRQRAPGPAEAGPDAG